VSFAPCHFCKAGRPYSGCGELLSPSTVFLSPKSVDELPFSPCHFCTAGPLPAWGSRLPPGSTISPGPFLPLLAALRCQTADPMPLPWFPEWYHCGLSLGDLLMLLYGLHRPWIGFSLCRF
jgi:hypothetical protein